MVVGVCKVSLMMAGNETLKDKRSVLRHIKEKVQHKFNCAIAEVGDNDEIQASDLGFSVVSNELGFTQSVVQKILQYIEDLAAAKVLSDEQDYINYGDESLEAGKEHWEPDEPGPMRPPSAPSVPRAAEPEVLPDWLPARFLEGADPADKK